MAVHPLPKPGNCGTSPWFQELFQAAGSLEPVPAPAVGAGMYLCVNTRGTAAFSWGCEEMSETTGFVGVVSWLPNRNLKK